MADALAVLSLLASAAGQYIGRELAAVALQVLQRHTASTAESPCEVGILQGCLAAFASGQLLEQSVYNDRLVADLADAHGLAHVA
jgi:hypothetical protein